MDSLKITADSIVDTLVRTEQISVFELAVEIIIRGILFALTVWMIVAIVNFIRKKDGANNAQNHTRTARLRWTLVPIFLGVSMRVVESVFNLADRGMLYYIVIAGILSVLPIIYLFACFIESRSSFTWKTSIISIKACAIEIAWIFVLVFSSCLLTSEFFVDTVKESELWDEGALTWKDYIGPSINDLFALTAIVNRITRAIYKR